MAVVVKVKYSGGQGVVRGLAPEDSLNTLIAHSLEALGLDPGAAKSVKMLTGFPPKPVDLSNREASLHTAGVKSGDTIIYQLGETEEKTEATNTTTSSSTSAFPTTFSEKEHEVVKKPARESPSETEQEVKRPKLSGSMNGATTKGELLRKVVPADNSCLFTSINFCMSGEVVSSEHSSFMREIIATTVSGDQDKYSEPILGRPNKQYCDWILTKDAWGGAIELQILAEYFQVEMAVVDTKSGSVTIFGECQNFPQRMLLIYDGIHYDPLYLEPHNTSLPPTTVHSTKDQGVLEQARSLAEEARAANNYTDTQGFTLKCLVCGHRMKGEVEAQAHAKTSGHINFSEV